MLLLVFIILCAMLYILWEGTALYKRYRRRNLIKNGGQVCQAKVVGYHCDKDDDGNLVHNYNLEFYYNYEKIKGDLKESRSCTS